MTSTSTCNLQRSTCHLPLLLRLVLSQCMCCVVRQCVSSSGVDLFDTLGFVRVTRVPTSLYRVHILGPRSPLAATSLAERRVPSSSQLARYCARSDHRACRLSRHYKRSQPLVCTSNTTKFAALLERQFSVTPLHSIFSTCASQCSGLLVASLVLLAVPCSAAHLPSVSSTLSQQLFEEHDTPAQNQAAACHVAFTIVPCFVGFVAAGDNSLL